MTEKNEKNGVVVEQIELEQPIKIEDAILRQIVGEGVLHLPCW